MYKLKILCATAVFILISLLVISNTAIAGETYKWQGTGLTTKFEQIEVGDVEGHVVAIMQAKQLFIKRHL